MARCQQERPPSHSQSNELALMEKLEAARIESSRRPIRLDTPRINLSPLASAPSRSHQNQLQPALSLFGAEPIGTYLVGESRLSLDRSESSPIYLGQVELKIEPHRVELAGLGLWLWNQSMGIVPSGTKGPPASRSSLQVIH